MTGQGDAPMQSQTAAIGSRLASPSPSAIPATRRRGDRVKRREFISLLGGVAAAWPLAARAQQPERVRQIAVLMGTSENDPDQKSLVSTFTRALADLGWAEGTNIRIERRWAEGDFARLRTHALDLARLAPDAIFAQGTPATTALRQAAPATPLVFVMIADPISSGLVSSFAYPGGNITGFTNYEFSMGGKWLEILKEMTASVDQVAVVFNPDNPALHGILRSIEVAGPTFRIQVNAKPGLVRRVRQRAGGGNDKALL